MSLLQSLIRRSALAALRGAEPGIARVGEKFVLENASAAEKSRPNGSNGNAEDLSRCFVRLVLQIDEQYRRLEWLVQLLDRTAKRRLEVDLRKDLVAAIADRVPVRSKRIQCLQVAILQLDMPAFPLTRPKKDVPSDGEEPATGVASGLKRVP